MGPREAAVHATLSARPAGVLYEDNGDGLGRKVADCFAGLHNGALQQGHLDPGGGLFLGKAECQWDWELVWPRMVQMGLVEYSLQPRANHPSFAGASPLTAIFEWKITEHGRAVRADDLEYFNAVLDARRLDAAAADTEARGSCK